ncbi:MAG: ectonucleotide pyrophosphatase/phosphodiesterase [Acidobacteriota bacterium]|nr:ectonucleotide pyrophosphatase/phosphodiesterase [Acidobacteriota bacterium]
MKRTIRILSFLIILFFLVPWIAFASQNPGVVDHVVLISIDGFRPDFYLDTAWPAPRLQQMAREGAHVKMVRGVFPSETYPGHTTLVTGALPRSHGIYYNVPFEKDQPTGRYHWYASAIRVPTLWDAVREGGLRSASVLWPVTVGAPIDWNIPEIWSLDEKVDPLTVLRSATEPSRLWMDLEQQLEEKLTTTGFMDRQARDVWSGKTAAYLLEKHRPSLLAVHLVGVDFHQHHSGRDGEAVHQAVEATDRLVGEMVEAVRRAGIADRTTFVVTGDHGFVDFDTLVSPNFWLVEAGLREEQRDGDGWRAVFYRDGGSVFLRLRDEGDTDAVSQVRELLAGLPPASRRLFRIIESEELERIGADPASPLALSATPGVSFTPWSRGPALQKAAGATHGHFPDFQEVQTGLIGWGAGFRSGTVISTISLEDIAPLVAELLGLELQAPDGGVPRGLLDPQR